MWWLLWRSRNYPVWSFRYSGHGCCGCGCVAGGTCFHCATAATATRTAVTAAGVCQCRGRGTHLNGQGRRFVPRTTRRRIIVGWWNRRRNTTSHWFFEWRSCRCGWRWWTHQTTTRSGVCNGTGVPRMAAGFGMMMPKEGLKVLNLGATEGTGQTHTHCFGWF